MLTLFGKELRKIRIEHNELMKDMAGKLGVTVSYLSAVENGKRNVPQTWINYIVNLYDLSQEKAIQLQNLYYEDQNSIDISLENKNDQDKDILFALARRYDALDSCDKEQLLAILKKGE